MLTTRSIILKLLLAAALPLAAATAYSQPAAPSGTWASANAGSNVVNWNPVPAATGYDVYRGTATGMESASPIATAQTSTQYTDSHVTAGVRYYYKIKAFYGSFGSALSPECSAEPGQPQPPAPAAYGWAGTNEAIIAIGAVPSATFYRIFRSSPGENNQLIATTSSLGYEDTTVTDGIKYTYYVDSGTANSEGGSSLTFTVIPGDLPPLATTFLYASPDASSMAELTWNPVPGATGYAIFRSTTHNGEAQPLAVVSASQDYIDSGLVPGTLYYYKIKTLDQSGASGFDAMEASAMAGTQPLAAPQLAAAAGTSSITLDWTAVPDATSYVIYRYQTAEGGNSALAIAATSADTYVDANVVAGVNYTYYVSGLRADGLGSPSVSASAAPGDPPLAAPTGVYATPGSSVYVSWNPAPGAKSYNVYRSTSGTPTLYATGVQSPLDDTSVISSQRYYYEVKAVYGGTEGSPSSVVSVLPGSTPLAAPEVAPLEVSGHTTLYWGFVSGAASYDVLRGTEGGTWTAIATGIVPGEGSVYGAYTDSTAAPGADYLYEVAAVDANGFGLTSMAVGAAADSATPPATTGISATTQGNAIIVQWNPVGNLGSYVYRSTTSGGEGYVPVGYASAFNFQDNSVSAGTTYYYKVRTANGENVSAFSAECSAKAGAAPLAAPVITTYSETASVEVYWSPVAGAVSYNLYRAVNSNGDYILYQKGMATTDFVDTNVVTADVYYYEVQAVEPQGAGSMSAAASVRPHSNFTGVSSGLYAVSSNGGSTQIEWNPVPGATSYNVFRATATGAEGLAPIATGVGSGFYYDSTAVQGKLYYYTVSAVVLDCQGAQSTQVSCLTGATPPAAPVLELGAVHSGSISMVWGGDGTGVYDIFRLDPFTQTWELLKMNVSIAGEFPSFVDTTVLDGLTYSYKVANVTASGASNPSNVVSASP